MGSQPRILTQTAKQTREKQQGKGEKGKEWKGEETKK
jgi:hypothetical protein